MHILYLNNHFNPQVINKLRLLENNADGLHAVQLVAIPHTVLRKEKKATRDE
jgi:hypothetical protein